MIIGRQNNLNTFLSATNTNIENIKTSKNKESINDILDNFRQFGENNKEFLNTNYEAYSKFKELARTVNDLSNQELQEKVGGIFDQIIATPPVRPKRKKGAESLVSPGKNEPPQAMDSKKQPNVEKFLSVVNQNITLVQALSNKDDESIKLIVDHFKAFAENNIDLISKDYSAYSKFKEFTGVVLDLKPTEKEHHNNSIEEIYKKTTEIHPERPKRKKEAGARSPVSPGKIERIKKEPLLIIPLEEGQKEGVYKQTGENSTLKKKMLFKGHVRTVTFTVPLFNISSKDMEDNIHNTYTTTKIIAKAGEASIFLANDKDGNEVAIRMVHLKPTREEIELGAPFEPGEDVKREGVFQEKMSETHDPRLEHLCLKSEVIISRDPQHMDPEYAYQVMPLAKASFNNLALNEDGEVSNKYAELTSEQQLAVATYAGQQLLSGLAFLHEHETVHHDVKMDNLLLMQSGTVKLTDFGFTKTFQAKSKMLPAEMTPKFISPELAKGQSVDGKTDIWSAGIALCELCGVKMPTIKLEDLKNPTKIEEKVKKLTDEVSAKSPQMGDLISKMLVVDTSQRITAAEALKHEAMQGQITTKDFMNIVESLKS